MPGTRTMLGSPALAGRLRTINSRRSTYERRSAVSRPRTISDMRPVRPVLKIQAAPSQTMVHRSAPMTETSPQNRSEGLKQQLIMPAAARSKHRRRRGAKARGLALAALAGVLFIFGVGVGVTQLTTNQEVKAQVQALATNANDEAGGPGDLVPSETQPTNDLSNYHVAPELPRTIIITKLGVEARVIRLGVKANNELKVPGTIYDAGWYEGSARPGETGTMFINGHVHGPTQPGVFAGLKKLRIGDKITIGRGDGTVFNYRVVKSQSYDKDNVDMGAAFSSAEPGKPGLNLMTCDGNYDDHGSYNKRLVVFAVQEL